MIFKTQQRGQAMTTLKKEYSISCKDYISLYLSYSGEYFIYCGTMPLTYAIENIDVANEIFYFHVNKI